MRVPKKATIIFEYGDGVMDYTFDLQELYDIIKEKQQRIDKAIEYIEKGQEKTMNNLINGISKVEIISFQHIIDILKGSDINE